MIDLHVPTDGTVKNTASVVGYITDGLDAVVLTHEPSALYPGMVHLVVTGNGRDLSIATDRAQKIGGLFD